MEGKARANLLPWVADLLFLQVLASASAPVTKVYGAFMSATNEYVVRHLIFIGCSVLHIGMCSIYTHKEYAGNNWKV